MRKPKHAHTKQRKTFPTQTLTVSHQVYVYALLIHHI